MHKVIYTPNAPEPIGPYSQATYAEHTLYVSGQIPLEPDSGELVQGSIEEETKQVMKNLHAILKEAGGDFTNVVKCSIFVTDMEDFARINEEYGKYFKDNPPARETVEVSALPKGVRVEISCIAIL